MRLACSRERKPVPPLRREREKPQHFQKALTENVLIISGIRAPWAKALIPPQMMHSLS
jgi:hypothetical protein